MNFFKRESENNSYDSSNTPSGSYTDSDPTVYFACPDDYTWADSDTSPAPANANYTQTQYAPSVGDTQAIPVPVTPTFQQYGYEGTAYPSPSHAQLSTMRRLGRATRLAWHDPNAGRAERFMQSLLVRRLGAPVTAIMIADGLIPVFGQLDDPAAVTALAAFAAMTARKYRKL
jgi:hypothetical protein